MPLAVIALASALSALPDIAWERERSEDAHQLTLCQIHRDQLMDQKERADSYNKAKAVCDLLAREYRQKWDFDAQDALAAQAIDFDELIRRGDAIEVPADKAGRLFE